MEELFQDNLPEILAGYLSLQLHQLLCKLGHGLSDADIGYFRNYWTRFLFKMVSFFMKNFSVTFIIHWLLLCYVLRLCSTIGASFHIWI